jgi:hypothetical protein
MFLSHLLDPARPLDNPLGFGASDWIQLAIAGLLLLFILGSARPERIARRLAPRMGWCMLLLALLPVALRLMLLANHPVPTPTLYDEFAHLLEADTLRHFRLANPPHALPQFFETFFVLQQPTYSSIYPMGQGLALALGWVLFGTPWAGVVLATAAFCALCYWMLRGWTTPVWALAGGLLCVIEFGPLNLWMNNYWGGAVAAAAGCLVFGSLPRLIEHHRLRDGVLLGAGLGLHALTRPFETAFLTAAVVLFFAPQWRKVASRAFLRPAAAAGIVGLAALGLVALDNRQVTGNWLTLPEMASRYQYGVPATFTFEPNPAPHRALTPQQEMQYRMQVSYHGRGTDTIGRYLERLEYRVRFYRFFFLAPLYLALIAFLFTLGRRRSLWILGTLVLFALGTNFYPFFYPHYVGALTSLFVLAAVIGLERLGRVRIACHETGRAAAFLILFLCGAHFVFWYAMHLADDQPFSLAARRYESWDAIDHRFTGPRAAILDQLEQQPGRQLVFVRYWPQHIFQDEWVYNAAGIDSARIVWARDLGPAEDRQLLAYFPNRTAWLLEADAQPPALSRYQTASQPLRFIEPH